MDAEMRNFADRVLTEMFPKLKASAMTISPVPPGEADVKFWVELGASIMLDKPIIAVLLGGRTCPHKLTLVADEVVHLVSPDDPEGLADMQAAIARVSERLDKKNG